ncbi:hypothetical protein Tco_0853492, partial [Tanacetum coccineum]
MSLTTYAMRIYAGCQDSRRHVGIAYFLWAIDWIAGLKETTKHGHILQVQNTSPDMEVCAPKAFGNASPKLKDNGFDFNKIPLYFDNKSAIALCRKCKRATPKKPTSTTLVKQTKPAPPPTKKLSKRKLPQKVKKGKPAFHLVDKEDKAEQESIPQKEDDDPDLELAKKFSLETPQEKGEGEGDDADLERVIKLSLDPAFRPQGRAPVGGVTIRDPVSEVTPKLHEVVGKGKAVVTEEQVAHSLIDLLKKKELLISLSL